MKVKICCKTIEEMNTVKEAIDNGHSKLLMPDKPEIVLKEEKQYENIAFMRISFLEPTLNEYQNKLLEMLNSGYKIAHSHADSEIDSILFIMVKEA